MMIHEEEDVLKCMTNKENYGVCVFFCVEKMYLRFTVGIYTRYIIPIANTFYIKTFY